MRAESLLGKSINSPTQTTLIKVAMADNQQLFIDSISAAINKTLEIVFCASFLSGKELLDWYTESNADVIILGNHLPIFNGVEASKQLIARFPLIKIIILSVDDCPKVMQLVYDMGIFAYLTKNTNLKDFIETIIKVHSGEKVFHENLSVKRTDLTINKVKASFSKISDREKQILDFIVQGKNNPQIAALLNLSPLTVKKHRENLMRKLEASNTAKLIASARLKGLL